MTDASRKKHEAYVKDVRPENRFIPSILSCSDVDRLFAALDAERGKVKRIIGASKAARLFGEKSVLLTTVEQILKGGGG